MVLPKNNTKIYSGSKKGVARYVKKKLEDLNPDCALIMIIGQGKSEDYSAFTVIEGSLADIERLVAKPFSKTLQDTYADPIPAG